jgi:hypothetical protein
MFRNVKEKEMLVHHLSIDNVLFNPNTTFVSCLWDSDFSGSYLILHLELAYSFDLNLNP